MRARRVYANPFDLRPPRRVACNSIFLSMLFFGALAASASEIPVALPVPPPDQAAEYQAEVPKTIIELQQFRRSTDIVAEGSDGRRGTATLVALNPQINSWFLLVLDWGERGGRMAYHLENPNP